MAFRSLFATRTDVCSSALLARNICVSSFRAIFFNVSGDVAAQWRTELVTWVLGAVAKPIETRVPKLLEKAQCDRPSSVWHWYEQGAIQTSWQLRNINNVCNVQGTLTCPTPPQPLPHILAAAEHQQRVQSTRNVNMPHPTPAPAPHPGSCGTSTTCATYKERQHAPPHPSPCVNMHHPPHPQTLVDVVSTSCQSPGKCWQMVKGTRLSMRRVPTTEPYQHKVNASLQNTKVSTSDAECRHLRCCVKGNRGTAWVTGGFSAGMSRFKRRELHVVNEIKLVSSSQ